MKMHLAVSSLTVAALIAGCAAPTLTANDLQQSAFIQVSSQKCAAQGYLRNPTNAALANNHIQERLRISNYNRDEYIQIYQSMNSYSFDASTCNQADLITAEFAQNVIQYQQRQQARQQMAAQRTTTYCNTTITGVVCNTY